MYAIRRHSENEKNLYEESYDKLLVLIIGQQVNWSYKISNVVLIYFYV